MHRGDGLAGGHRLDNRQRVDFAYGSGHEGIGRGQPVADLVEGYDAHEVDTRLKGQRRHFLSQFPFLRPFTKDRQMNLRHDLAGPGDLF